MAVEGTTRSIDLQLITCKEYWSRSTDLHAPMIVEGTARTACLQVHPLVNGTNDKGYKVTESMVHSRFNSTAANEIQP